MLGHYRRYPFFVALVRIAWMGVYYGFVVPLVGLLIGVPLLVGMRTLIDSDGIVWIAVPFALVVVVLEELRKRRRRR